MASDKELRKIKKTYGERFMKMCRTHFPTILEKEDKLFEILQANFSDISETLYEDIQSNGLESGFVDYVFEKFAAETTEPVTTDKTPYELLDEAGYVLVECTTEKEIERFKKYYAEGEELCTFHGGRLDECVVFWAVRKDVANIKRKDFTEPSRDDEYGTSVMSIQFNREGTTRVSIKNRYNHTVENPDATLGNDLERIAPGLTYSFGKVLEERGLILDSGQDDFRIPGYVKANDGKYYKYNTVIGDTYYCPENIVIVDGNPQKIPNQEKCYLVDCYVIDTETKTIRMFDESVADSFPDAHAGIKKIEIVKDKEATDGRKHIMLYKEGIEEPIVIAIDKDDKIIGYSNHELERAGDGFLANSSGIEILDTPNIRSVGSDFCRCASIEEFAAAKLESVGDGFLRSARKLKRVNIPSLEEAGKYFLRGASSLEELELPRLQLAEEGFCGYAHKMRKANLPMLIEAESGVFETASRLDGLNVPQLRKVGDSFCVTTRLTNLDFPSLEEVGSDFVRDTSTVEKVDLPKLKRAGEYFLADAGENLKSVKMPELEKIGSRFLCYGAEEITEFETPKISRLKWHFSHNRHINKVIKKAKKAQRIMRKDLARLDAQTILTLEEIDEAKIIVEEPSQTLNRENIIQTDETIK